MSYGRSPLIILMLAGACGGGATLVNPPPPPPAALQLVLLPDSEDVAAAQALGWVTGIPHADVVLTPPDSSAPSRPGRSSAAGVVDFGTVPAGNYLLEASRWLSAAERAQLPAGQDVNGWVVRAYLAVQAGGGPQSIPVPASHRRSLVISEWAFNVGEQPGLGSYQFGGFAEVYNNGDSTVYLDGMALGRGLSSDYDYPNYPCTMLQPFSADSAGVWSLDFQVFPGSGRDYPVPPGGTVVIATDAIDHRPLFPDALDLRGANFEFVGSEDVDNPAVPNMINLGYDRDLLGHGVSFPPLGAVLFLAQPLDYASLSVARYPGTANVLRPRIPAGRLLDVLAIRTNFAFEYPECDRTVNVRFDREGFRGRGPAGPEEFTFSVERSATPIQVAGQVILQHTHTGNTDLFRGHRTPGRVSP
jgi:hypothetical protein